MSMPGGRGRIRVLNVGTADLAEGSGAPGTVLSATPEGLVVACVTGAVRLNRLTCQVKGLSVCPSTLTETTLPALTADEATRLTAVHAAQAPRDGAQRKALAALSPLVLPGTVSKLWELVEATPVMPAHPPRLDRRPSRRPEPIRAPTSRKSPRSSILTLSSS